MVRNRSETLITAIECKFSIAQDNLNVTALGKNFKAFRKLYPEGENLIVSTAIETSFTRTYEDIVMRFVSVESLINLLKAIPERV